MISVSVSVVICGLPHSASSEAEIVPTMPLARRQSCRCSRGGMGVFFCGTSVRGQRVGHTVTSVEGLLQGGFQVPQLALGPQISRPAVPTRRFRLNHIRDTRAAGRPSRMTGTNTLLPTYPNDAAHGIPQCLAALVGQRETGFFDDGLVSHSRNALKLRTELVAGQAAIQREFELLSLAHAVEAFVSPLLRAPWMVLP